MSSANIIVHGDSYLNKPVRLSMHTVNKRSLMTSHHQIEPCHMVSPHLPIHDVAASVLFHSLLEWNHTVSHKCLLSLAFTTPVYRYLRCYPGHRKWIYPTSPPKTAPITTVTSKEYFASLHLPPSRISPFFLFCNSHVGNNYHQQCSAHPQFLPSGLLYTIWGVSPPEHF